MFFIFEKKKLKFIDFIWEGIGIVRMENHPAYPKRLIFKLNGKNIDDKTYHQKCPNFTHENVIKNMNQTSGYKWADEENTNPFILEERQTFFGNEKGLKSLKEAEVEFDSEGKPVNPKGRTGLKKRGLLGKWGPNHAADPIVAYLDENDEVWVIMVRRKDTGQYAIPGGMVDAGNTVSQTLKNEIFEEAIECGSTVNIDKLFEKFSYSLSGICR